MVQHMPGNVKHNRRRNANLRQLKRRWDKLHVTAHGMYGIIDAKANPEVNAMPAIRPRTKDRKVHKLLRGAAIATLAVSLGTLLLPQAGRDATASITEGETPVNKRNGKTVMYIMDEAGMQLRDEDAERIDQLNYSFALIRDGRADGSHWTGVRRVEEYLRKHPHIDGVLSVGGWGADGFSDACATEAGRQRLADSLLDLMDAHGFVGVDIDWEYPGISGNGIKSREEDVDNWYALLAVLREGLDRREAAAGREYILSAAIGAGDDTIALYDYARLNGLLDQLVLMTYDLRGFERITGHHAGLYPGGEKPNTGARAVKLVTEGGFHAEKLLLGVPAYARVWRQVSGGGDGLGQRAATSGNKTIHFDELLRLEDQGYTRHYDEEAQAAYWFNGSTFVSGEDDRSIAEKCRWLREKKLLGAAVWSVNQDPSGAMLAMLDAALRE